MQRQDGGNRELARPLRSADPGGWAGWLMARLRGAGRPQPQLRLLERIAIAPRQTLALVEAEGRRFLLATSGDGAPAFYPLEEPERRTGSHRAAHGMRTPPSRTAPSESFSATRVSW
jgi:Flagellar biosynthesis protein, FliO